MAVVVFAITHDRGMTLPTWSDSGHGTGSGNRKWKEEVEIAFERKELEKRFQRLLTHFRPCPTYIWHCRHSLPSADTGNPQCRPRNRKWKPEVEIAHERQVLAMRFQRLPPHFRLRLLRIWHCRECPTSAYIGNSNCGHETGSGNRKWK